MGGMSDHLISTAISAVAPPADNDTVTVAEAAAYLARPERTVRRWAAMGKLDAERVTVDGGREEWRIHRRALTNTPNVTAPVGRQPGRSSVAMTVPVELYRDTTERLEAALLQVGQLTEVRSQLLLAERTESTLREDLLAAQAKLAEARAQIEELSAPPARRRWFGISRK